MMWTQLMLLLLACLLKVETTPCRRLKLKEENSYVCVCNANFCDDFDQTPESLLSTKKYLQYESSREGGRLELKSGSLIWKIVSSILNFFTPTVTIQVDTSRQYQEILGFGGAITDTAGLNIVALSKMAQENLIKQYFGSKGIGYTFLRVPFGGTDFSTYNYTYDDVENDVKLEYFSLKKDDFTYKIPYIKMAQRLSPKPVKLFSSTWSSPEWMKELRNGTVGFSKLKKEYYKLYAEYYIRCLDEYKKNGVEFWGLTPQNEPFHGVELYHGFNSLGWTAEEQRDWLANFFGPALNSSGYGGLKVMTLDDSRIFLPQWAEVVLGDPLVRKLVSGIALHWYFDEDNNLHKLPDIHNEFPDKFLLYTESSVMPILDSTVPNPKAVRLGNWDRAENYTSNIMQDINNWVTGWVDWNIALDTEGGPNWVGNYVDSPIIVNAKADEFYKQPMFYALAHFAKFVLPGSRRIEHTISSNSIECVSVLRPDNVTAIVLQNRRNTKVDVRITVKNIHAFTISAPAHSIHTLLFKAPTNP